MLFNKVKIFDYTPFNGKVLRKQQNSKRLILEQ